MHSREYSESQGMALKYVFAPLPPPLYGYSGCIHTPLVPAHIEIFGGNSFLFVKRAIANLHGDETASFCANNEWSQTLKTVTSLNKEPRLLHFHFS